MRKEIFWIFGILQSVALSLIHGERVIGLDTHILLSVIFPIFLLIGEYGIFTHRKSN